MQNKKWKKMLVFALVLTMLAPSSSILASSTDEDVDAVTIDNTADSGEQTDGEDEEEEDDDELPPKMTDQEALGFCKVVAENDNFTLYYDDGEREEVEEEPVEGDEEDSKSKKKKKEVNPPRFALLVKETGKIWWSNPINAFADDTIIDPVKGKTMKDTQRKQIASNVVLTFADLRQGKRTTKALYSCSDATEKVKEIQNGLEISYYFKSCQITVPVKYVLEEDGLRVSVDTTKIVEKNNSQEDGKVITNIALAPQFGAAPATNLDGTVAEGYMVIPDGTGAVVNYNNGKSDYAIYSQKIYGRDYTAVPLSAPKVTEQAYMPVLATVSGNDALVSIAEEGHANATANAQVNGQNNQSYNSCYFQFELRSSDIYYMSGDVGNKLTVFEKGDISTPSVSVKFTPISDDEGVNYADVAKVYRDYLVDNGLTSSVEENKYNFYLDLYGGVLKQKSILGIPFDLKTSMTSFEEAKKILEQFDENGVEDMVVAYNDWTNKLIKENISTKYKPSGTLGGKSDFKDLKEYMSGIDAELYPTMDNFTMNSSTWGYWTLTNTAIRISNAYSRQSSYSIAFGVEDRDVSPALLTPNAYGKVFGEIIESFGDNDQSSVSFGNYSTALVSDFLKREKSVRYQSMNTIISGYEDAIENGVDGILCDGANGYLIKYADHITDVPLYSSGYNLSDYDIPLYQMVVHGYVPYASESINKTSDVQEAFLLSIAYGAGLHYDMIYENASEVADTEYNDLYYAYHGAWIDTASKQNKIASSILAPVSKMTISDFKREGNVLTTTYSAEGKSDVVVVVDLDNVTVTVNGVGVDLEEIKMTGGLMG
ncbi:MAG: hypothetical protein J6A55_00860 [Oscillospiraceae bacterium]|nr:hypothetical protein [Oscillospiraceae bacterium]